MVGDVGPKGSYLSNFRRLQKGATRGAVKQPLEVQEVIPRSVTESLRKLRGLFRSSYTASCECIVNGYVCEPSCHSSSALGQIGVRRGRKRRLCAAVKSIASFKRFSASKVRARSAFYKRGSVSEGRDSRSNSTRTDDATLNPEPRWRCFRFNT